MSNQVPDHVMTRRLAYLYDIDESVALDILYLDHLRERVIAAARRNPKIRDFLVYNPVLEEELDELEKKT